MRTVRTSATAGTARVVHILTGLVVSGLISLSAGCHLLLPLEPGTSQENPLACRQCSARIYRTLPGTTEQISYEWQSYVWHGDNYPYVTTRTSTKTTSASFSGVSAGRIPVPIVRARWKHIA